LIKRLADDEGYVRRVAAEALGKLGDARAVPALIKRLADDEEYVRSAAAKALGESGDIKAVGPLETRLPLTSRIIIEQAGLDGEMRSVPNPEYLAIKEALAKLRGGPGGSASSSVFNDIDNKGGIDMNNIEVDGDGRVGGSIYIQFNPVELQAIIDADIDGLTPVMINFSLLPSVLPLLGLEPAERKEKMELSAL
jgi:hypothetical protein